MLSIVAMVGEEHKQLHVQTTKARARSMDTLAALRETSTAGLTSEQEDTALKRLLGQSWQVLLPA